MKNHLLFYFCIGLIKGKGEILKKKEHKKVLKLFGLFFLLYWLYMQDLPQVSLPKTWSTTTNSERLSPLSSIERESWNKMISVDVHVCIFHILCNNSSQVYLCYCHFLQWTFSLLLKAVPIPLLSISKKPRAFSNYKKNIKITLWLSYYIFKFWF